MNFLQRAIKNISRIKTKSILLIMTFFLIGNLVIVGLGINYASENAKTLTRLKMKPVVTYEIDYESYYNWIQTLTSDEEIQEAYNNYPRLRKSDFVKLLDNQYIEVVNEMITSQVYAGNFSAIKPDRDNQNDGPIVYKETATGSDYVYVETDINLIGNDFDNMIELYDGTYVIDEGRFYTKEEIQGGAHVAVIESRLATANNLKIGDKISIKWVSDNGYERQYLGDYDANTELEIIGIYTNNKVLDENQQWMNQYPAYLPENQVLVPGTVISGTLNEMNVLSWKCYQAMYPDEPYYQDDNNMPKEDDLYQTFVILLDDPLHVEAFVAESADKLIPYAMLNANDKLFKTFAKPLDTMSLFASIIVWIVVVNAVVIISLITALTLKTREHEIGILLSMGVGKMKVVGQLLIELAVVAVIGFTLAVVSGSMMAKGIGDAVLEYQMANTEKNQNNDYYYYDNSYFTSITQDDMLSEYKVSINPLIIAEIYALGLGVVAISIMIPSYMIMRFNPKRILTNTY